MEEGEKKLYSRETGYPDEGTEIVKNLTPDKLELRLELAAKNFLEVLEAYDGEKGGAEFLKSDDRRRIFLPFEGITKLDWNGQLERMTLAQEEIQRIRDRRVQPVSQQDALLIARFQNLLAEFSGVSREGKTWRKVAQKLSDLGKEAAEETSAMKKAEEAARWKEVEKKAKAVFAPKPKPDSPLRRRKKH